MRFLLAAAALLLVTAASSAAATRPPMTRLLAMAHGRGAVTISAPTTHLHGRMWLYRSGGSGMAHAKATLACDQKMTDTNKGYSAQWFELHLRPNAHAEVWRYTSPEACIVTVALTGKGLLTVALRGY